ncbi:hypothetical protein BKA56DRAFT_35225 [Ilyonectria sp. MPI-CAGE-AT-0026]|nr:hypothetical protein BKA56DRAFT_35225 [Ilyonectria sp. MPI-CAGE-AT-0026]
MLHASHLAAGSLGRWVADCHHHHACHLSGVACGLRSGTCHTPAQRQPSHSHRTALAALPSSRWPQHGVRNPDLPTKPTSITARSLAGAVHNPSPQLQAEVTGDGWITATCETKQNASQGPSASHECQRCRSQRLVEQMQCPRSRLLASASGHAAVEMMDAFKLLPGRALLLSGSPPSVEDVVSAQLAQRPSLSCGSGRSPPVASP